MAHKLDNYLLTYRKRAGFSQAEVAYLLGTKSGTKVSRYERCRREPSLEAALACEVIFNATVSDLFAGLYERVERETATRTRRLAGRIERQQQTRATALKLAALRAILEHRDAA